MHARWLGLCLLAGWGLSLAAAHCGGPAVIATAPELPSAPRHPDGVLLDPPPSVPSAQEHAPARGVVALRQPVPDEEVVKVVRDFFQAFEREDIEALRALAGDAVQLDSHGHGNPQGLLQIWQVRLRSFDYTKLAGLEVFRPEQIERFDYDDLGDPGERPRPGEMKPGDLLVRVPVEASRVGGDKLFADVEVFLLRRDEGRFHIAGYGEEEAR